MKLPSLSPLLAWVVGVIISAAICFWPGGLALFVVAMWGGFSPNVSIVPKMLVLGATLAVISAALFFVARSIANALVRK